MVKVPLLEAWPELFQYITYNLIMDCVALVILALLIVQFIRRKHRSFELTLFFQMCISDVLMTLFSMVLDILPAFWKVGDEIDMALVFSIFILPHIVDLIFAVILLAQWIIYVEYTLHQSRDLIRRRYPALFVVFVIAAFLLIMSIPLLYWRDAPFDIFTVSLVISLVSQIALFLFIIAAYVIWYREKRRNRIPEYIRLTPTSLCLIAGFTLNLLMAGSFLSEYSFLPLLVALGLMFADYYMYRRLNGIDPDTGLFNGRYLSTLISFAKKKKLTGATVIQLKVPRAGKKTAELLKFWEPDLSKTINMGDGLFLIVSEPVKDTVANRFISLLSEQLKNEGIPVDAGYETDRDAPLDEILRKYV